MRKRERRMPRTETGEETMVEVDPARVILHAIHLGLLDAFGRGEVVQQPGLVALRGRDQVGDASVLGCGVNGNKGFACVGDEEADAVDQFAEAVGREN